MHSDILKRTATIMRAGGQGPWLLLVAMCVCAALYLRAEDEPMRGYYLESFRAEDGLPQNTIKALLQTRDGYLWIVTPFGLARFDGVEFKTFTSGNTPGLHEDMFTSLAQDRDGVLWAGTRDGLLRYEHGSFERLESAHGLPDSRVDALCSRRAGGVWLGTREGLGYVSGRRVTVLMGIHGVDGLFEDRQEHLWFSVNTAVFRYVPSSNQLDRIADKKLGGPSTCFWEEADGTIWFGTRDGLHRWRDGVVTRFDRYAEGVPLPSRESRRAASIIGDAPGGGLWVGIGGGEGLHWFKEGTWRPAGPSNPSLLRDVTCSLMDAEGNLWLGTESDGLLRLRHPRLQTYGSREGLLHDKVWSVCSNQGGAVWVGGDEGFARIVGDKAIPFRPPGGSSDPVIIRSILEDRSGRLWVGDHAQGVFLFEKGEFTLVSTQRFLKALYEDRSGAIWVGVGEGITRIRNQEVKYFTTNDGLAAMSVRAFHEDRQGTMWIGSSGEGVHLYSNGTFRAVRGLSSHKAWSFHEDAEGVMWIGTDRGLNRYEKGKTFVLTRKHGLFDDLVNHIVEDDAGVFWISCNRGIYRVSRQELNDVAAGRARKVTHVAYGEADGMASSEANGEHQPAGCKTADGRIWFPTQRGLVVIDPKTVYRNELAPPVIIEQILANDQIVFGQEPEVRPASAEPTSPPTRLPAPVRLAPGWGRVVEIRYTANSFVEPSKVQFKHLLEGYDTDWREAGTRRVAYFTNLRPGSYKFRVMACNNHGYWNEQGAEIPFVVEPRFYERWSFYGLCALGFVACAAAVQRYRLRVQRRLLQLEQQAALQRERARIAQDMHDDLGANLTKIAILSEVTKHQAEDPARVRSTADTISGMARTVVDHISEIVWVTNPRNDALENLSGYLRGYAASFFDATDLLCRIDFPRPDALPDVMVKGELRRDILLVFKEALNNVVRHSGATEVTVGLEVSPAEEETRSLLITVSDNGWGFDEDKVQRGNGLRNMRSRVARRGGNVSIASRPGQGTRIVIRLSLTEELQPEPSTTFM
jgi:ligand-binding sensor domain-containing protein/signal transduction histidine kinase